MARFVKGGEVRESTAPADRVRWLTEGFTEEKPHSPASQPEPVKPEPLEPERHVHEGAAEEEVPTQDEEVIER